MPIDYQALLEIARVNEEEVTDEQFKMDTWINSCGTAGCLIGNWLLRSSENRLRMGTYSPKLNDKNDFDALALRFGITHNEARFLFDVFMDFSTVVPDEIQGQYKLLTARPRDRSELTRQQNIQRIRKFVDWKLRRQEIFADYERARRQEGDWMVAQYAIERSRELAQC